MNKKFDQLIDKCTITNSTKRHKQKQRNKKSTKVISRIEYWLIRKEQQWHDDEYEAGKDW